MKLGIRVDLELHQDVIIIHPGSRYYRFLIFHPHEGEVAGKICDILKAPNVPKSNAIHNQECISGLSLTIYLQWTCWLATFIIPSTQTSLTPKHRGCFVVLVSMIHSL